MIWEQFFPQSDVSSSPQVFQFYDYIIRVTGGRREEAAILGMCLSDGKLSGLRSVEKGWESISCTLSPRQRNKSRNHCI